MKTITLNDGRQLPVIGFGTWEIPDGEPIVRAIGWALEAGYRHIDTASYYRNETGIGQAVRESGLSREEIWITTKIFPNEFSNAKAAIESSLERLGLDYIDLYLVHWPPRDGTSGITVWRELEEFQRLGLAKSIGVSNYDNGKLSRLLDDAEIVPVVNQIETTPFWYRQELIDFCREKQIAVEAYSPLTRGEKLGSDKLCQMALKYGKSPAQILIRWGLDHGLAVVPKSSNPEHIKENIDIFDFTLENDDLAALDDLDRSESYLFR